MKKEDLKMQIEVARGFYPADTVIKNCHIVNVYTGEITEENIAVWN